MFRKFFLLVFSFQARVLTNVRTMLWRQLFAEFGNGSRVYGKVVVYHPERVSIGSHCTLNEAVMLNARAPITIGNYVHLSPQVMIHAGGLDYRKTGEEREHIARPVTIEDGVWIGAGAIVVPGVIIGKNEVIGAGSVVSRDVPQGVVAVGVPAIPIRKIDGSQLDES